MFSLVFFFTFNLQEYVAYCPSPTNRKLGQQRAQKVQTDGRVSDCSSAAYNWQGPYNQLMLMLMLMRNSSLKRANCFAMAALFSSRNSISVIEYTFVTTPTASPIPRVSAQLIGSESTSNCRI